MESPARFRGYRKVDTVRSKEKSHGRAEAEKAQKVELPAVRWGETEKKPLDMATGHW